MAGEILLGGLVIVGIVVLAGPRLFKRFLEGRMRAELASAQNLTISAADPVLEGLDPALTTVLYFTADWCAPCRSTQFPVIQRITARWADQVQLCTVDVEADPAAAQRWQVQSLPRTVILRPGLRVYATNIGLASERTLNEQIEDAQTESADAPVIVTHEELKEKGGFRLRIGKRDGA